MPLEELEVTEPLRFLSPSAAGEAVRDGGVEQGECENAADDGREEASDTGAIRVDKRWESVEDNSGVSVLASEREVEDWSEKEGISAAVWCH